MHHAVLRHPSGTSLADLCLLPHPLPVPVSTLASSSVRQSGSFTCPSSTCEHGRGWGARPGAVLVQRGPPLMPPPTLRAPLAGRPLNSTSPLLCPTPAPPHPHAACWAGPSSSWAWSSRPTWRCATLSRRRQTRWRMQRCAGWGGLHCGRASWGPGWTDLGEWRVQNRPLECCWAAACAFRQPAPPSLPCPTDACEQVHR